MKTLEELKQEVLNEYDDKVVALAQYLEIDLNFAEEDYKLEEVKEYKVTRDVEKSYFYLSSDNEVYSDINGNTPHFETEEEANTYLKELEKETQEEIEENEKEKQEALNEAIDDFKSELDNIVDEDGEEFSYYRQRYYVLTDSEADQKEDEYLDNYIDECLEIPEHIRPYFDEAWKRDARMDGRGHTLNRYDGTEYEEKVNGTWYYIYRQ